MFSSAGWPALQSRGLSQYSKPLQVPLSVICLQSKQGLSSHMANFCDTMNVFIISMHWGIQAPPFLDKTDGWVWVVGDIIYIYAVLVNETQRVTRSSWLCCENAEDRRVSTVYRAKSETIQTFVVFGHMHLSHGQKHTHPPLRNTGPCSPELTILWNTVLSDHPHTEYSEVSFSKAIHHSLSR